MANPSAKAEQDSFLIGAFWTSLPLAFIAAALALSMWPLIIPGVYLLAGIIRIFWRYN